MKVLTTPSQDGNGFAVDSADLVNTIYKLGKIERKSFDLLDEICQHRCRHEHDAHKNGLRHVDLYYCQRCPVTKLHDMIYKGGRKNELDRDIF